MGTEINPAGISAALYIRLSKEDDREAESESIGNQRSLLRAFTETHGLAVYGEYIDDGFSGGNFDRPAFRRLIGDIEAKRVNLVVTKDMSRLGRDYIQTGHYMERYFPEHRVRYISLLDGIDTGVDSSQNDITPFRALMNDMYARDISRKIKSVKRDKQRRGLFIGGKAPYGYRLSAERKNTLVIDEGAAENVRLIFQMALAGESCRGIASRLNGQNIPSPAVYAGLPTPRKGPYAGLWSAERVSHILKNRMYLGHMVQGTVRRISYKSKKSVRLPPEQWAVVENTHPAIVGEDDFEAVQLLLGSRRRTRERTLDHPLKGLLVCRECGYPLGLLRRTLAGGETLYFICRTYQRFTKAGVCTSHCVRADAVTDAVGGYVEQLCRAYEDRAGLRAIAEEVAGENRTPPESGPALARIASQIDRLYADRLNEVVTEADFRRLYARLCMERAAIEAATVTARVAGTIPDADVLIERFVATAGENRELLCGLIERIELTAEKEALLYFRSVREATVQG